MENVNPVYPGGDSRVRLFIASEGVSHYACSFEQKPDNSIYVFLPDVESALFMAFDQSDPGQFKLTPISGQDSDHVSIHASGQAHLRLKAAKIGGKIKGFGLGAELQGGVRHLFSAVFAKHQIEARSQPGARKSDHTIGPRGTENGKPLCLIFFAVPHVPGMILDLYVEFGEGDHTQYVGAGHFRLKYHQIVCFMLKPDDLREYPDVSRVMYSDGYWVPIVEEDREGVMRFGIAGPKFEHFFDGQFDNIKISLRFAPSETEKTEP